MRTTIILLLLLFSYLTWSQFNQPTDSNKGPYFHTIFDSSHDEDIACYRIPSLVTAPNGDLIAAIDERVPSCGDLKWSKDINIVLRRSTDHGQNWLDIERIIDFPLGQSASDPSMVVDRQTNEIFLFYNFMDHDKAPDRYFLHVTKSKDMGKTWSPPEDITSQITKEEWLDDFKFITSGRGIQTRDGRLLHCLVNLDNGTHVFGSDDHGKSWYLIDTPLAPANESKIIELSDGRWMVNSRANGLGLRQIHLSSDNGANWTTFADSTLIDPGCNASIIRFTSRSEGQDADRMLFSNAYNSSERKNMTVKISYDEGRNWSEGKTIYDGGSAYSTLTVLQNGDIGLLYEKDGYATVEFVSFDLAWLTDGADNISTVNR